ncbi:MAG: stage II sporulation protein P [Oscillospiraceae bacterium]|nr:stage II sporulation protein P [Oscillospiraceae bacterium]
MKKKSRPLTTVLMLLLPALLLFWGGKGAAVLGAAMAAPDGALELLFQSELTSSPQAPNAPKSAATTVPDTTEPTEQITQSHPTAGEAPKTTESAVSKKASDITATPADIAALAAKSQAADKGKKAGNIREFNYAKSGATDTYQNVRVRNTTKTASVDIKKELEKPLDIGKKPAILIFHTHTTESYNLFERDFYTASDSVRTKDSGKNIVRIGRELAGILEAAGYRVIHDTTIHDSTYNGSYNRSRATVEKHLAENPDIQVVLDIHRDAIHNGNTRQKPVAKIEGKKAAQIMIITGVEEGGITNFPNWRGNLTFALHLQKALEDRYPQLTRAVFFCSRRYNMNLGKNNLLIEIGSDANTLDEAAYTARMLGTALAELLAGS